MEKIREQKLACIIILKIKIIIFQSVYYFYGKTIKVL